MCQWNSLPANGRSLDEIAPTLPPQTRRHMTSPTSNLSQPCIRRYRTLRPVSILSIKKVDGKREEQKNHPPIYKTERDIITTSPSQIVIRGWWMERREQKPSTYLWSEWSFTLFSLPRKKRLSSLSPLFWSVSNKSRRVFNLSSSPMKKRNSPFSSSLRWSDSDKVRTFLFVLRWSCSMSLLWRVLWNLFIGLQLRCRHSGWCSKNRNIYSTFIEK